MKEKNYNNISVDKKSRRLTKLNNVTSIDSISERNEESSNSTNKNKLQSKTMLKNNWMIEVCTPITHLLYPKHVGDILNT